MSNRITASRTRDLSCSQRLQRALLSVLAVDVSCKKMFNSRLFTSDTTTSMRSSQNTLVTKYLGSASDTQHYAVLDRSRKTH